MAKSELTTGTQAIDRATALLTDVLQSQNPQLLGSLARTHDIPKSTTSRILGALERAGLVQRDRNGAFLAGQVLTSFAREQNQDSVLVARMRTVLDNLSDRTGETSNLAVPGNGFINLLDQVDWSLIMGWNRKQNLVGGDISKNFFSPFFNFIRVFFELILSKIFISVKVPSILSFATERFIKKK